MRKNNYFFGYLKIYLCLFGEMNFKQYWKTPEEKSLLPPQKQLSKEQRNAL
jgi:hypothetical protein